MGSSRSIAVDELPDAFLLRHVGFSGNNEPIIDTQVGDNITTHALLGVSLSLSFDMSTRYCTGWIDIEQRHVHPCPDHAVIGEKYEQCIACRNKTGFNPAFYHAKTISQQQEAINRRPHVVYLAYFAPGLVKVGITQEARGIRRLLEQGARMALKLKTFPSALIARQYEERISGVAGVVEHVVHSRKLAALAGRFDEVKATFELERTKVEIERALGVTFDEAEMIRTSEHFHSANLDLEQLIIMKRESIILGTVRACIGSDVIVEHDDRLIAHNLKSYVGYKAQAHKDLELVLPHQQMMLFCYNRPMRRTGK